jgi:hypothetical protein
MDTTIMHTMTEAILAVAITTAIITAIEAAIDAVRRAVAPENSTFRALPMATPRGVRRQPIRGPGVSRPIGVIPPQYLPALAQSRLLRRRTAHQPMATRYRR